jgi:colanic acid/amylovoran biosynthesis glycosyltransferase
MSGTRIRIWATHLLLVRSLLSDFRKMELSGLFNQFDLLYFYWGLRWSQILPFLPEEIKAKIAVRFHGSDLYEHTNYGYIPWRNEQLLRIDKAIAISETGKKYIEKHYPFLKDKIIVSHIGTKDYGLNPSTESNTLRIISCSNLVPVKRVDRIAKTLALLKSDISWIHFGAGPEINVIKTLIRQFPENINAELRGAVGHNELMDYYRTTPIDLFLNVSSSEGVPVSVMEAISFGIPVIATDVGGTFEIVSEKTGRLIDADFTNEMLAGIIEEFRQKVNNSALRKSAREEWEKKCRAEMVYPAFINQLINMVI